jgi:hypothetical protein
VLEVRVDDVRRNLRDDVLSPQERTRVPPVGQVE